MNTKDKGAVAEAAAIFYYIAQGYEVSTPLGDRRRYDLIVDNGLGLSRVQVKYLDATRTLIDLRITGGNQSFHTSRNFTPGDFDEIFVYRSDGAVWVLPAPTQSKGYVSIASIQPTSLPGSFNGRTHDSESCD